MVESIVTKEFVRLNGTERRRLTELTNTGHSGLRRWLQGGFGSTKLASMVLVDDTIVGWAACRQWGGTALVGAYVDPKFRGQGYGKKALRGLMGRISQNQSLRYAEYERGFNHFFQPVLEEYGFKIYTLQRTFVLAERLGPVRK